jgi:F-type H+-transporting ATPase subunit delta
MSFTKKSVSTYAKSLFETVKEKSININVTKDSFDISKIISKTTSNETFLPNVYVIGEELSLIRAAFISSKNLEDFFNNPTKEEQQKLKILLDIFPGLTSLTKSFLKVLAERSNLNLLPEINDEFTRLLLKFQNSTKVKLITASSLQESYGLALLNTLKELTASSEIILNISYNPKLLGGIIIEYNSVSIDASILKEFSLFFNEV